MIKLTRLDGTKVYVNTELIAFVEEPDTRITLTNGQVYLFRESARGVVRRIMNYRVRMLRGRSRIAPEPSEAREPVRVESVQ